MSELQEPHEIKIVMPPDMLGGVWANFAMVRHSQHEFTLDFMRADYDAQQRPVQAVVVARVNMSPLFVTQLQDALGIQWQAYADKSMPKEVRGDEPE